MSEAVETMWPTPTASENANRNTKPCPSHGVSHGKVLAGEVNAPANWNTPTSFSHGESNPPGTNAIEQQVGGAKNAHVTGDKLSPAWVTQLMGFPDGWLDGLPAPEKPRKNGKRRESAASATTEQPSSKPSETPSCRK